MSKGSLKIHEVGLRDGLQMEARQVPIETRLRWIGKLLETGLDVIQLGSFVHPKLVPQMADSDEVFRRALPLRSGPTPLFSGLVLNEKGLERGFECGVEMFCMGVSASETHSVKNTRMSVSEALDRIISMAHSALSHGSRVQVSVQSAFGCGYEGPVPEERVLSIVERYLEAGLEDISLADTAGHADPLRVSSLLTRVRKLGDPVRLTCHFHNTYGMALANCEAALGQDVDSLESSVAGLGGCPFTRIAGGNVCTEDLVHMLQRMELRTDLDLPLLIEVAQLVADELGRDMPGTVHRVGPIPEAPA